MVTKKMADAMFEHSMRAGDEAYKSGYESEAADIRQKRENDAKLAQLIKGDTLKQQAIDANLGRAKAEAARTGMKPGKYSVSATEGGFSLNPENEGIAGLIGLQYRQQEADERKVAQMSDRITKSNLPRQAANMRAIEQATQTVDEDGNVSSGGLLTNPDYEVKSVGPVLNITPDFAKPAVIWAGEKLGTLPNGTADESRALQQLINVDTREMSGVAVTAFENARNRLSQGLAAGADPKLIRQYAQEAHRALQDVAQNVESGYNPRIRGMYQQFGGTLPSQDLNLGGAPKAPGIDIEAIRRERARRQGR